MIKIIKIKQIKKFFKKLFKKLAEKAFLTFLGLFVLSLIVGSLAFYRYNILTEKAEVKSTEKVLQFELVTYSKLLEIWQERDQKFEQTENKEYSNFFIEH